MLAVRMLMAAAGGFVTLARTANPAESTANSASHTFSSASLGAAASDRVILVAVGPSWNGIDSSVSSVTVAGNSATQIVAASSSPGADTVKAEIWAVALAAGTTGDVVVTLANPIGTNRNVKVAVYRMTGTGGSITASDTATDTESVLNLNTNTVKNGAILCVSNMQGGGASTTAWVGPTEDIDETTSAAGNFSTAFLSEIASASTPLTITATISAASAIEAGVAAAWSP